MKRTIIAYGGGLVEQNNDLLNLYLLAQLTTEIPRVLLISTASGDHPALSAFFKEYWGKFQCKISILNFFQGGLPRDLREIVCPQDLILVSGGNTKSMLGVWREWGLPEALREAYNQGTVLAGGSAGAVCWFRECLTDSFGDGYSVIPCLDFLPFSCCPHYSAKSRRVAYSEHILNNSISSGYAITDKTALHFQDEELIRGVSTVENQSAHFLTAQQKTKVNILLLREKKNQDELIITNKFVRNLLGINND